MLFFCIISPISEFPIFSDLDFVTTKKAWTHFCPFHEHLNESKVPQYVTYVNKLYSYMYGTVHTVNNYLLVSKSHYIAWSSGSCLPCFCKWFVFVMLHFAHLTENFVCQSTLSRSATENGEEVTTFRKLNGASPETPSHQGLHRELLLSHKRQAEGGGLTK